jgi:hypothetical protein
MRFACCVALALGCQSVSVSTDAPIGGDGAGGDGAGGDAAGDASAVDAAPVWQEIADFPFTELGDRADAVPMRMQVFLARKDAPQWLRAYDLASMQLQIKMEDPEVCNCGLVGTLVGSEDHNQLFYFANSGKRYDITTNTWLPASVMDAASNSLRRGEAATGYHGGRVWQVGGRDTPFTSQAWDPDTDMWESPIVISDYPLGIEWGAAIDVGGQFYVIGGRSGTSDRKVHLLAATVWQPRADAPFDMERPSVTTLAGKIAAVSDSAGALAIYDPGGDGWTVEALPSGITGAKLVAATSGSLFLFYQTGSTLRVARYIGPSFST